MQSRPRLTTCVGVAVFAAVLAGASRGAGTPPINPNFQIRSIGIDGTGARNLSQGPLNDYEPAVSPDGRKIAFSRATTPGDWDLWVMNSDGTGQRAKGNDSAPRMRLRISPDPPSATPQAAIGITSSCTRPSRA